MFGPTTIVKKVKRMKKRNSAGFTLVELLVVSTILIVLTTIGLMSFRNAGQNSRDGKRKADIESVRQALVLRRSDTGSYPSGAYAAVVDGLIADDYLTAPRPTDPKGTAPFIYTYSLSGTDFCLCANQMENPANANASACGAATAYCVENP